MNCVMASVAVMVVLAKTINAEPSTIPAYGPAEWASAVSTLAAAAEMTEEVPCVRACVRACTSARVSACWCTQWALYANR